MEILVEWQMLADVERKGKVYVARLAALDIQSQGPTVARSLANLREAVELFIESCYERGVLERVLKDAGFESAPITRRRTRLPRGRHRITVPMSLATHAAHHAG